MFITQYRWGEDSAIQRVDVRDLSSGTMEAYIHAPADTKAGELAAVPAFLKEEGYEVVSDNIRGQNVLRVSGFKDEDKLFNSLSKGEMVIGAPQKQEFGEKERKTVSQHLRAQSVKASGIAGMVGHAAMAVSGVLEKKPGLIGTSLFYSAATSLSAVKGAGDASGEFFEMVEDMRERLKDEGLKLPENSGLTSDDHAENETFVQKLGDFVGRYPLQIGNIIGATGNIMLTTSSLKKRMNEETGMMERDIDAGRLAGSLCSLVGGLSVALIPERVKEKDDPANCVWPGEEKNKSGKDTKNDKGSSPEDVICVDKDEIDVKKSAPKRFADWVREKPMRFAGGMLLASNAAFAYQAVSDQRAHNKKVDAHRADAGDPNAELTDALERERKAINFTYATAGAYFLSSGLTMISSKQTTPDYNEQEMLSKLCAYSANLLAESPEDVRTEAISHMAEHLSAQPKVTETADEIIAIINDKVDKITQGPWVARTAMEDIRNGRPAPDSPGASV